MTKPPYNARRMAVCWRLKIRNVNVALLCVRDKNTLKYHYCLSCLQIWPEKSWNQWAKSLLHCTIMIIIVQFNNDYAIAFDELFERQLLYNFLLQTTMTIVMVTYFNYTIKNHICSMFMSLISSSSQRFKRNINAL